MGKNKDELIVRLKAEQRIYDDSPSVAITYKDFSRMTEVLLQMIEDKEIIGFKQ